VAVPSNHLTPTEIRNLIHHIRGKAVMVDSDIANLYQVPTFRLNESVKRNSRRFPDDFMFQLTEGEFKNLISQIAISSSHGGRRKLPYVFTEQGVTMLSCVLNSDTAIDVNLSIMRAFVQMRRIGMSVVDLKRKIDGMERKYDQNFKVVFDALRQLITPPVTKKPKKMGFTSPDEK
jgi:hypothetical protein